MLVPVLNESRWIVAAVASMAAQEFPGTLELVFADGGSTDDTRPQLERLAVEDPRIRVLDNPRGGTASGLNVCLAAARGTYVVRMDAHSLYPPTYVRDGIERLERGGVAWVAGPQHPVGDGAIGRAVAAALATRLGRGGSRRWSDSGDPTAEYELDTGVFCGVWRRADVLARGGWDEDWPRNQDSEMAARFLSEGERIVCLPAMAARYIPRDSIRALFRQYRDYGRYRARTAGRHPASLRRSALLPPLLTLDAAWAAAGPRRLGTRALARAGIAAYGAALAGAAFEAGHRSGWRDAPMVPLALAIMHLAHGVGFALGCARWGVPWAALTAAVRGGGAWERYDGPVEAPSLCARDDR